jgi:hypothetical protein
VASVAGREGWAADPYYGHSQQELLVVWIVRKKKSIKTDSRSGISSGQLLFIEMLNASVQHSGGGYQ